MKRFVASILMALVACLALCQDRNHGRKAEFVWDAGFEYDLDNREFDRGGNTFTNSCTIHAARLSPSVGLQSRDGRKFTHTLLLGVDVMKEFGENPTGDDDDLLNTKLFREITFSYDLRFRTGRNMFEARAGVFPRNHLGGEYGDEFLSDSLRFYDNNIEGLVLQWHRPASYYEVGVDWQGKYGETRRERFLIFSYGRTRLTPWLAVGWTAQLYHLASSAECKGVVDNALGEEFARFSLPRTRLQKAEATIAHLNGYHRDRLNSKDPLISRGGLLTLTVMNWGFGMENRLYYGTSQMPYYDASDAMGEKYASDLYHASPFYRIHADGTAWNHGGLTDRLEVFYAKDISGILAVRAAALLHFGGDGFSYQGIRQKISLIVNLNNIK